MRESHKKLAIHGGSPIRGRSRPWPTWPTIAANTSRYLQEVLESGRWAISSPRNGADLFERRFALMFAKYLGARYCVPVDHGSSALVVALEALNLEYGTPVLVPALTWTASASAAFRAGLVPVLVDVDVETGCVSPENLWFEPDPRAIIVVHWAAGMADVPAIRESVDPRGMVVIEDCAQAHGARWRGRSAGTLGMLGCFSMQHSKVLTGGEGGAIVTDVDELPRRLQELRADSRSYRGVDEGTQFDLDLVESAGAFGANFCMSEFSAAVLCGQLALLDRQNKIRETNYRYLMQRLAPLDGITLITPRPEQSAASIYEGTLVIHELPEETKVEDIGRALTAELGAHFYPVDVPLNRSELLKPWLKPSLKPLTKRFRELYGGRRFPNAEYLARHGIQFHHSILLGDRTDMDDVVRAVEKVYDAVLSGAFDGGREPEAVFP